MSAMLEWWSGVQARDGFPDRQVADAEWRRISDHVGDLLEPGRWYLARRRRKGEPVSNDAERKATMALLNEYDRACPERLGQCSLAITWGDIVGRCFLPKKHDPWPGSVTGHRYYVFSARDSAQMLEGMKKRLAMPMEKLT